MESNLSFAGVFKVMADASVVVVGCVTETSGVRAKTQGLRAPQCDAAEMFIGKISDSSRRRQQARAAGLEEVPWVNESALLV